MEVYYLCYSLSVQKLSLLQVSAMQLWPENIIRSLKKMCLMLWVKHHSYARFCAGNKNPLHFFHLYFTRKNLKTN